MGKLFAGFLFVLFVLFLAWINDRNKHDDDNYDEITGAGGAA